jgi:hypothetical protein
VAAGQLGLTGGPSYFFSPKTTKKRIQLLLEAQQHKNYAQTTPLDDGISFLFIILSHFTNFRKFKRKFQKEETTITLLFHRDKKNPHFLAGLT